MTQEEKKLPDGLEEAAWDCVLDNIDVNNPVLLPKYKELLTYLFKAGAEWQKAKMIEKTISWLKDNANKYIVDIGVGYGEHGRNVELVVGGKCWDDLKKAMEDGK